MEKLTCYIEKFDGRRHENWTSAEWNEVIAKERITSGMLLSLGEAANFVGHKHNLSDATIKALYEQMEQAAGNGLTVRNQQTEIPYIPTTVHRHRLMFEALVRADELDSWLESQGVSYRIQTATPGVKMKKDIKDERGGRRHIRENWANIKALYGDNANGIQVLRVVNRNMPNGETKLKLKNVQNKLLELRKEKLIP